MIIRTKAHSLSIKPSQKISRHTVKFLYRAETKKKYIFLWLSNVSRMLM